MTALSVSRESYIARANTQFNLGSIFQISAIGGQMPASIQLRGYDRDEYAGRETYNYGSLTSSGATYHSGDYSITFTLRNGQYYTSSGDTLSNFTFTASSQENRLQNLNLSAYGSTGGLLETRNLEIVTRASYVDATPGAASATEIASVARTYLGQVWDDCGCWNLATVISASSGASLCLNSGWISGDVSANGQWGIAYSGYSAVNNNWFSSLHVGDMVEMGWSSGGGHIVTVSRIENGHTYIIDNSGAYLNAQQRSNFALADNEDLTVAEEDFSTYVPYMNQRTVVVHRLADSAPAPTPTPAPAPTPAPNPGAADDTIATARNLGSFGSAGTAVTSVSDFVGNADRQDFYSFTITARTRIDLTLTGLSNDADLYLYNQNGQMVNYSARAQTADDTIGSVLDTGTYYARVIQYSGDTNYTLRLQQNSTPTATAISRTLVGGGTVTGASLFSVSDPTNAAMTQYRFRDNSAGGGYLTSNGVAVTQGQWITVNAADLASVGFTVGNINASDGIDIQAYNGRIWSNTATATITSQVTDNTMATATALGSFGSAGSALTSATGFVGASDQLDYYSFQITARTRIDLTLTGLSSDANLYLYNQSGQLLGSSANGGAVDDNIGSVLDQGTYYVRVIQGTGDTNYSLRLQQNSTPTATAISRNLQGGGLLAASSLFTVSDPVNAAMTQYRFRDNSAGGGTLTSNGSAVTQGQWLTVNAADLGRVGFNVGNVNATDNIEIQAFNGRLWSNSAIATITSQVTDNTMATARSLGSFGSAGAAVATANDFVGNSDQQDYYSFQITARTRVDLTLTGLSHDANLYVYSQSGQLLGSSTRGGVVDDTFGSVLDQGTYYVRVIQGTGDTNYTLRLQQNSTPTATAISRTLQGGGTVTGASLFSVSDPANASMTQYRFRDTSTGGGALTNNGSSVTQGQWLTVNAADLGRVGFSVGNVNASDNIEIQAYNGRVWSNTATATVSSQAVVPASAADDTMATARNLGAVGSTALHVTDSVGTNDRLDFYKFQVGATSRVNIGLTGMSNDADLYILNASGQLVGYSINSGSADDRVISNLAAGTYYVAVAQYAGNTAYDLNVASGGATGAASSLLYRDSVGLTSSAIAAFNLASSGHKQQPVLASGH